MASTAVPHSHLPVLPLFPILNPPALRNQGKPEDSGILPRAFDVIFNSADGCVSAKPRFLPKYFDAVQLATPDDWADAAAFKADCLLNPVRVRPVSYPA